SARTLILDIPGWPGHLPGQHVDVRLTAEDGYSTQRSYSLASAPGTDRVELTVQRVDDGEVSPYLIDELAVGEQVELRGPVGGCCGSSAAGWVGGSSAARRTFPPCWGPRGARVWARGGRSPAPAAPWVVRRCSA